MTELERRNSGVVGLGISRIVVVGDPEIVRQQLPRDAQVWAPETLLETAAARHD